MTANARKRILAIIVAAFMVITIIPPYSYAADNADEPSVSTVELTEDESSVSDETADGTEQISENTEEEVTAVEEETVDEKTVEEQPAEKQQTEEPAEEQPVTSAPNSNVPVAASVDTAIDTELGTEDIQILCETTDADSDGYREILDPDGISFSAASTSDSSQNVTTVYFKNISGQAGVLEFEYVAGSQNEGTDYFGSVVSGDGVISHTSGGYFKDCETVQYSESIGADETLEIVIKSTTAHPEEATRFDVYFDSLKFTAESENVTVTFPAVKNGSYTVNGEAVADGIEKTGKNSVKYTVSATPDSGYVFFGWVDADGKYLSEKATYTFAPLSGDMTVKPVFASEKTAHFRVGDMKCEGLDAAIAAAESGDDKTMILMNDASISGSYTIPEGITLLIPFDEKGTLYNKDNLPECVDIYDETAPEQWVEPKAFRTLTMEAGAELIVYGTISLSAKHTPAAGSKATGGVPYKYYGEIAMAEGSSITVNNGGYLYAFGYITGNGNVTAESGAGVYEYFQIMDFRGGSATTDMVELATDDENPLYGVLPLNQYYVQNIEVPMTIKAGATETCYTSVRMTKQVFSSAVVFIGKNSDAMFKLSDGYITKDYDEATDRLTATVNGDMKISPIALTVGDVGGNSKFFELPISNNITIDIRSGSAVEITQDIALIPGTQLLIEKGAECVLGEGTSVYVYDADEWGNFSTSNANKKFQPLIYAPGREYNRTEQDLVDAVLKVAGTLDASKGYVYTTKGGANITGEESGVLRLKKGSQTVTYQFEYKGTPPAYEHYGIYHEIEITPAKLFNGKDYVTTTAYPWVKCTFTDGTWNVDCDHSYNSAVTEPTCTAEGYTTYTCERCSDSYKADYTDKKDHTEGEAATCTTDQICTVCKTVLVKAHHTDITAHEEIPATCEAEGREAYWECKACDKLFSDKDCTKQIVEPAVIAVLGHDWDNGKVTTAPTCTEKGVMTYTCGRSGCGQTYTKDIEPAHTPGTDEVITKLPTCTEEGISSFTCTVCGISLTDTVIPATGHQNVTMTQAVAATCEEDGQEAYWTCTAENCGKMFSDKMCTVVITEPVVIPATGHQNLQETPEIAATCEEDGQEAYWTCTAENCGKMFSDAEAKNEIKAPLLIEKLKHNMIPATHTEPSKCTNEGCTYTEGKALGHGDALIELEAEEASCEVPGYTEGYECTECGAVIGHTEIKPLGHDMKTVPAKVATYTSEGWKEHEKCSRCGEINGAWDDIRIAQLPPAEITSYSEFVETLVLLEEWADEYVNKNPGKDPAELVIKYIRTGVEKYNPKHEDGSGSWGIMAGYEDEAFKKFVEQKEDSINSAAKTESDLVKVSGLRNLNNFTLPNGDKTDFGHMFGTMDITYFNSFGQNHADVAGWAGDIVDLLSLTDQFGVGNAATVDEMAAYITENYLLKETSELQKEFGEKLKEGSFSLVDMIGDLDAMYIMNQLKKCDYEAGDLTGIIKTYFAGKPDIEDRAAYFIDSRIDGTTLRKDVRKAVHDEFTKNSVISLLESTREFTADEQLLDKYREASCYAFADYICKLAGDYNDTGSNPYVSVFSETPVDLAPGITQKTYYATSADNKNMAYYTATIDVTRDDVHVFANYRNNDPSEGWGLQRVSEQAEAAQAKYGDPESSQYIENYNVIAAINGAGFNMDTGEPGGFLTMKGTHYHEGNGHHFFGILDDGSAVIAPQKDYYGKYDGRVQEAISAFGALIVQDGKIASNLPTSDYFTARASRTAIGITKTGKVVFMVLDGRQGTFSCGGSMTEIAQIMVDAGCVTAINLDGGGSSTYVAKLPGDDMISCVNNPSDGIQRRVSTSLMAVSTAPSSTKFDHAVIECENAYLTAGTQVQMTATGVSATNNVVDMPEDWYWTVADPEKGTIDKDGKFMAFKNGDVEVKAMVGKGEDAQEIGTATMHVVTPTNVYFARPSINAEYGKTVTLPVKAVYNNKEVLINPSDAVLTAENKDAGYCKGFDFTVYNDNAAKKLKSVKVTATLNNSTVSSSIIVYLYNEGEVSFDFDNATSGDRQFAWNRTVTNSKLEGTSNYRAEDMEKDMDTSYTFAIDMSQLEVPEQLKDLTYRLPGADKEGASAWSFLCNLAERISALTNVTAVIDFDDNVDVDYSELELINDYFTLEKDKDGKAAVEFDKATNTMSIKLNWIKQSVPIDVSMANPICILKGIKVTAKDGVEWPSGKLKVVNSGYIGFKVCMRASSLYSFSQKAENQSKYGLYAYENPADEKDRGGCFETKAFKEFSDTYTLDKSVKNGWVSENGGKAYYKNGKKLTGIKKADGYYYDFGKDGINYNGKYSGEMKGTKGEYYVREGVIQKLGWVNFGSDDDWRYYNEKTGIKEKVTKTNEVKATCIIMGSCTLIAESGAEKKVKYNDHGGHEYIDVDGKQICENCGWEQFAMKDCVSISKTKWTYTGKTISPRVTAINPKTGEALKKSNPYRDYITKYSNNTEIGTAKVKVTAAKYSTYVNVNEWRGNYRNSVTVYYTIHPEAATNVKYTISSKNIATVTWDKSDSAESYRVQYSKDGGKTWTSYKSVKSDSCDVKLSKNSSYMFRVQAKAKGKDENGDVKTYFALSSPIAKLSTVTGLKVLNEASSGKPKVIWTKVRGADKYKVYRATSKNGTFSRIATTSDRFYVDTKAVAGKKYFYKVVSVYSKNAEANSPASGYVIKICKLAKPVIKLNNSTKGRIKVTWKKVTGATSYKVYRKTAGGKWKLMTTTSSRSYINKGLKKGKKYYYRVVAVKKGNASATSANSAEKYIKCK